jgi:photosystem II stability/assembly factor-like uncharacterized protein
MKTLLLFFRAFLFLQFASFAQEGWFWQNPLPHGHTFYDVHVIDSNTAIAVGGNMITKTTNGGDSWSFYPLERYIYFNSVHFIDDNIGWVVGNATIFKTTNQGEEWVVLRCDTNSSDWFTSIFFIDENVGWLTRCGETGCHLQKTIDGGLNWETKLIPYFSTQSVFFFDLNNGWTGGEFQDSIYFTTNGGDDWFGSYIGSDHIISSIYFPNLNEGWAVGTNFNFTESTILKTTNGGLEWFEQQIDSTRYFSSVYFLDSQTGWVAGNEIFKTTNGGLDWFMQTNNNYYEHYYAGKVIHFAEDNTGWCVGRNGYMTKTVDGNSWIPYSNAATNAWLTSTHFVDAYTGWAVGYYGGAIVKTTDGGENWFQQTSNTSDALRSTYFIDSNNGWAVGGYIHGNDSSSTILNTTDGGDTWVHQTPPFMAVYESVFFVNNSTGWAVGRGIDTGVIIKTTNSGAEWVIKKSNPDGGFTDVFFADNNIGWVTGDSLYKSTDGGERWIGLEGYYKKIHFIDQSVGWAIKRHEILKTTNGGEDWNIQYSTNNDIDLNDVYFVDENYGWVVGWNLGAESIILYTTNGGLDWVHQWSGTSNTLFSVYFTDNNNGWIVGGGGTILHTTNGGVSFIEETEIAEIPTGFYLSNNFPDPFNPTTRIRYSIPQTSQVVITVFDILGNEIETLVNEERPVGTYEITWYAENLTSGVYFYRLQVRNFIETKKMLLLK